MRARPKSGFTLIEILVSIGIFVVAALVMLGTLLTASEIFRRGESARQAGDEAVTVLAALRDDLSRAVPIRFRDGVPAPEWGRFYADAKGPANSCRLGFIIENPDRTTIEQDGGNARRLVMWRVQNGVDPTQDQLVREEKAWSAGSWGVGAAPFGSGTSTQVITRGCLHFGVWTELAQTHRMVLADATTQSPDVQWEAANILPYADPGAVALDTSASTTDTAGNVFYPQPDALRISLVLTGGGRYAARGTLARKLDKAHVADAQIAGIKALSTISGSALRIENEWIGYDNLRGGKLVGLKRGAWRSVDDDHPARTLVLAGQPFSLVVALPR